MREKNYTIAEAAEISRMSQPWWRQKIFRKEIRHLKIGRRVFIPESVIDEIFEEGIVEPSPKN
jgi:excisionase family DNA binding protein